MVTSCGAQLITSCPQRVHDILINNMNLTSPADPTSTSALVLAGAAVSHATAALLQTPCQNQVEQVRSPKSHDSPVIVHAADRTCQRVSFDLTDDNKLPNKRDSYQPRLSSSDSNNVFETQEDEIFEATNEVVMRDGRGSGSLSGSRLYLI